MNVKILFIVPYPYDKAPSQRLKFEQYYSEIEGAGYVVSHSSFISENFWKIIYKKGFYLKKLIYTIQAYLNRYCLLFNIHKYNIVYIHLWGTPFGLPIFEWLLNKLAKKIIYDIDDLVYLKKTSTNNKFVEKIKSGIKPIFLIKHADHVITCTPYLDTIAKQYNPNTTDISSTINTDTYIPVNTYKNDHQLVIGWSGSHTTSRYLYLLTNILLELKKTVNFKLLVIGDPLFNIPGIDMEAIAWSEQTEVPLLQKIDIGLYPLPLNDKWVLGKSGLKALQYMALGIPTIATYVGCNDRVIENEISGFLVKSDGEWLDKIMLLYNDPGLRKSIGEKARTRVEKHFSIQATAPVYLDILKKTVNT